MTAAMSDKILSSSSLSYTEHAQVAARDIKNTSLKKLAQREALN